MSTKKDLFIRRLKIYFINHQKSKSKLIPKKILSYAINNFKTKLFEEKNKVKNKAESITGIFSSLPLVILLPLGLPGIIFGSLFSGAIGVGGILTSICLVELTGLSKNVVHINNKKSGTTVYEKFKKIHFSDSTEFKDLFPCYFDEIFEDTITGKLTFDEYNKIQGIPLNKTRKHRDELEFTVCAKFKNFDIFEFKSITLGGITICDNELIF